MNQSLYMGRLVMAVGLLLLLALAPARAQMVVYVGETTPLSVEQKGFETYEWDLYNDGTVNFATTSGNCPVTMARFVGGNVGATVNVEWLQPGIYFYRVIAHDAAGCTMNLEVGILEVKEAKPVALITPPDMICEGDIASLEITITEKGPWQVTIMDSKNNTWKLTVTETPYVFKVKPLTGTFYWVSEVSNSTGKTTDPSPQVWQEVIPRPVSGRIYLN